jgi:protein gp37
MSKTGIAWTDEVWNPTIGCSKIGEGCANCYAEQMAVRLAAMGKSGYNDGILTAQGKWTGKVKCLEERLTLPLHQKKPRRIFVDSMSDLFHPQVPDGFIMDVWRIMGQCYQHQFQILTKRPERMLDFCQRFADAVELDHSFKNARGPEETRAKHTSGRAMLFADMIERWGEPPDGCAYPTYDWMDGMITWPAYLDNVHLLASASTQAEADKAVPTLMEIPAAVRGLSLEPLLGPIDLRNAFLGRCGYYCDEGHGHVDHTDIDWIIVGCESGPKRRPCKNEWVESIVRQCKEANVKIFVKQIERDGKVFKLTEENRNEWPSWAVQEYPKGCRQ